MIREMLFSQKDQVMTFLIKHDEVKKERNIGINYLFTVICRTCIYKLDFHCMLTFKFVLIIY